MTRSLNLPSKWRRLLLSHSPLPHRRSFRSNAALEALARASEQRTPNLVLYNYPSFSGAFSACFAHLFHSQLNLPCLILPFSSVEPLRVDDLCIEGLEKCYLLDFLGPKGFAAELSRLTLCEVTGFEHRKSVISKITSEENCCSKLKFHINLEKSSSTAVYEYFSAKFSEMKHDEGDLVGLIRSVVDQDRVEMVLKYAEDGDLRHWSLSDIKAFNIGIHEWRSKLNCITNPHMYKQCIWNFKARSSTDTSSRYCLNFIPNSGKKYVVSYTSWWTQLLELSATNLVTKGNSYISSRRMAVSKLLDKVFKVRLGRGFYGECLGVRVDQNSNLSDEIGRELSIKSAAAGLSPIGAVIYMQRNNLKMCLRSIDEATDTSEVAKAYGGGGSRCSSSFIIRMDEYNQWISAYYS